MKHVEPSRVAIITRFAAIPLLSGAVSAKGSGFRQLAPAEAAGRDPAKRLCTRKLSGYVMYGISQTV